jgi:hypothetical protein
MGPSRGLKTNRSISFITTENHMPWDNANFMLPVSPENNSHSSMFCLMAAGTFSSAEESCFPFVPELRLSECIGAWPRLRFSADLRTFRSTGQ